MKSIKTKSGSVILVDGLDYDYLNQWKWCMNRNGYAFRNARVDGRYKKTYMHRLINKTPNGLDTDHINRNKLDNRRANLRSVSRANNNYNMLPSRANKSGVKGVCWDNTRGLWRSYIGGSRNRTDLGRYKSFEDAVIARKEAEVMVCG
jgi:hypothetical protein